MVLESSAGATTTHYSFLTLGGPGRRAGGRGRLGGDQTSVGVEAGGGAQLLFWGMRGGSSTRAEGSEVERVDKMADTRIRLMWRRGAREQCGSNERCTGSIDSLKNLTISLVWTRGGRRGGG